MDDFGPGWLQRRTQSRFDRRTHGKVSLLTRSGGRGQRIMRSPDCSVRSLVEEVTVSPRSYAASRSRTEGCPRPSVVSWPGRPTVSARTRSAARTDKRSTPRRTPAAAPDARPRSPARVSVPKRDHEVHDERHAQAPRGQPDQGRVGLGQVARHHRARRTTADQPRAERRPRACEAQTEARGRQGVHADLVGAPLPDGAVHLLDRDAELEEPVHEHARARVAALVGPDPQDGVGGARPGRQGRRGPSPPSPSSTDTEPWRL